MEEGDGQLRSRLAQGSVQGMGRKTALGFSCSLMSVRQVDFSKCDAHTSKSGGGENSLMLLTLLWFHPVEFVCCQQEQREINGFLRIGRTQL